MIFGLLMLITALALSSIAAYYSVLGLLAIFAAAGTSIVALGSIMEVGKIVATVWLHQNWHRAGRPFQIGLGFFVAGLMFLTSMGIFGYLSKGHIDQGLTGGDVAAQLEIIDEKIRTQRENIEAARRALAQMDASVDQTLSRSTGEDGARRSAQLRRNQRAERAQLQADIQQSQKEIARLNEERAPISASVRRVEAEVGPIKYIAALIYGDNPGADVLERAVRWVIILIVAVFDPLALTLILAANRQFEWAREDKKKAAISDDSAAQNIDPEPATATPRPWTQEEMDALDAAEPAPEDDSVAQELIEYLTKTEQARIDQEQQERRGYLEKLERAELERGQRDRTIQRLRAEVRSKDRQLLEQLEYLKDLEQKVESLIAGAVPVASAAVLAEPQQEPTPEDTAEDVPATAVNVKFGTIFPSEPAKGDMFIRVDTVPTRLFKFSGRKWIEIDKTVTDTYSYNEQYIKHLIDRLQNGEYSVDDLTEAENLRIDEYLSRNRANQ